MNRGRNNGINYDQTNFRNDLLNYSCLYSGYLFFWHHNSLLHYYCRDHIHSLSNHIKILFYFNFLCLFVFHWFSHQYITFTLYFIFIFSYCNVSISFVETWLLLLLFFLRKRYLLACIYTTKSKNIFINALHENKSFILFAHFMYKYKNIMNRLLNVLLSLSCLVSLIL